MREGRKWTGRTRRPRGWETQTAAAFFVGLIFRTKTGFCSKLCRNSQHVYSRLSCRLQRLRNLRLLRDTNKSTDFHVFPKPFPTAGLTAQLHKQSPVGATRQLLCSCAAIPCRRHFLEKVRKNRIFVVFLRKEKTKKLRSVCKEHCWARSRNCKLMRC